MIYYIYDASGNVIGIKYTNGNTITDSTNIALINPFRYRSYYYDSDIGMYYLNSRYYNSEWGRFINADGTIGANQDTIGNNLYAYVSNNPITFVDKNGDFAIAGALGAIATAEAIKAAIEYAVLAVSIILMGVGSKVEVKPATKAITKDSSNPNKEKILYPENPYEFNPKGLIRQEWSGDNGKIIKWQTID